MTLVLTKSCESNAIDLVDYGREPTELDYAHMIQSFQCFLFDRLVLEGKDLTANPIILKGSSYERNEQTTVPAPITQLVGIDMKNTVTCFPAKRLEARII
ncbi:hypothetical protein C8J55DRAFT_308455 [Lentinula edodes]|uniref:PAN2 UCH domain-containing protein n=1 Tax=Lentinula lateritia TaxID=40482 RepID=A0A9W9DCD8_9AGAR|nr:hypothetical protein C8J55DRAFT_308455 [Lentinula edodes]